MAVQRRLRVLSEWFPWACAHHPAHNGANRKNMKRTISVLLTVAMLSLSAASFTSCSTTPSVITNVQAWLNDPKNQALINEIAQAANILIGAFAGKKSATTQATVVGKLAVSYPNVPAGALRQIAADPNAYIKK